jgi:hypothetical protein
MRIFDIAQANALVPQLAEIFTAVRGLLERIEAIDRAVARLGGPASEGAASLAEQRQQFVSKIAERLEFVTQLGVEVKAVDGLVDFRAVREGRIVYLCWKYGEGSVGHWHELDAGFLGRQPIKDEAPFAPSYLC